MGNKEEKRHLPNIYYHYCSYSSQHGLSDHLDEAIKSQLLNFNFKSARSGQT